MKKLSTYIMLTAALLLSLNVFSIPKLNSNPSASATIFLDFDGHYVVSGMWNGGNPINCIASGMSDPQITEVFNRVAEDYRPFDINITTDSTKFLAAPLTKRMRLIITPTSAWFPGAGGVALLNSFTRGDDTPCFAFCDRLGPNYPKAVAEVCSHESGHTVGLSHQSKYGADCTTPIETYNIGTGSGEVGWAPIMGNGYYRNMTNWNNGPTPAGCTVIQDNLSIITTQNGFGYRTDDYGQAMNSGTYSLATLNFSLNGIISTNNDKDAFRLVLGQNSNFHLTAVPFNVGGSFPGANLDIKIEIYNSAGTLINTYDPSETMGLSIDTVLLAGTYYFLLDGTSNANIGEYGSLGAYTISGNSGTLPIHDISLTGTADKTKHILNWNIIADEPIKTIIVETSTDGSVYTPLVSVAPGSNKFSYVPFKDKTIYYRLKVASILDQTMYSNTIVLRGETNMGKSFFVSTLVKNEIMINAADNYQYQLGDMNGRMIKAGTGSKGINKINFNREPDGMYIIHLFSNNKKQIERIIKQ